MEEKKLYTLIKYGCGAVETVIGIYDETYLEKIKEVCAWDGAHFTYDEFIPNQGPSLTKYFDVSVFYTLGAGYSLFASIFLCKDIVDDDDNSTDDFINNSLIIKDTSEGLRLVTGYGRYANQTDETIGDCVRDAIYTDLKNRWGDNLKDRISKLRHLDVDNSMIKMHTYRKSLHSLFKVNLDQDALELIPLDIRKPAISNGTIIKALERKMKRNRENGL